MKLDVVVAELGLPVCSPTPTGVPTSWSASRSSTAHWIVRAGPSNIAMNPVTGQHDQPSPIPLHGPPRDRVMRFKLLTPPLVASDHQGRSNAFLVTPFQAVLAMGFAAGLLGAASGGAIVSAA